MPGFRFGPHIGIPHVEASISSNQDNWNGAAGDGAVVILLKNAASVTRSIRGIADGQHGRIIFIVLTNGSDVAFVNGYSGAPDGSKLYLQGNGSLTQQLSEEGVIAFWYDGAYLGVGAWVQVGLIVS